MAYIVQADLRFSLARLAELTDSPATQGVVDAAVVGAALEYGAAQIDLAAFNRYQTPISLPAAEIVRVWNVALARAWLYRNRETVAVPEAIQEEEKIARDQLAQVRERKLDIPGAPLRNAITPPTVTGGAVDETPRLFGRVRDGLG